MTLTLVCMADTHTFQRDWRQVPDGDLLVHAGDLTRRGTAEELEEACAWLRSLPHPHKVLVAGNHDWLFQTEPDRAREIAAGLIYLEDSGAEIAGLRFWGSPWQPEFGGWAFNLKRGEALAKKWRLIPDDTQVLVTHGPPRGALDDAAAYRHGALADGQAWHEGCADLRDRIAVVKPRLHIFGHIHCNQGVLEQGGTRFVNCTTDECERAPVVVELD